MKGSSKKERSEFEESWRKAFDQAHMEPGIRVWENIDARLTNSENNKFKRKIVWYKWVAAASLLIGLGLSYIAIDQVYFNNADRLTNAEIEQNVKEQEGDGEKMAEPEGINSRETEESALERGTPQLSERGTVTKNEQEQESPAEVNVRKNDPVADNGPSSPEGKSEAPDQGSKRNGNSGKDSQGVYGSRPPTLAKGDQSSDTDPSKLTGTGQASEKTERHPENKKTLVPALKNEGPQLATQPRIEKAALVSMARKEEEIVPRSDRALTGDDVDKLAGLGHDLQYHAGLYEMTHMYLIPGIMPLMPEEDKEEESYSKLFAGVSFSSGVFDPNFSEGNTETAGSSMMSNLPIVSAKGDETGKIVSPFLTDRYKELANSNERAEPAFSYAYGINVGKRLSKRWVIQGGVKYGKYSSNTSTSAYVQDPDNNKLYPLHLVANAESTYQANRRITTTRDYKLKNNFEFISIPLEAGYILVDRKIDVLVSAGVGTRIFLKNNLEDQSNLFEDVEVTPGADSPYKDLFFNGLFGAEISYQFGGHYTISLAPSYSLALSSFTKSETVFTSNPKSLSMSLGLRYFF